METKDFTLHREGVDGDFDVTQYGTAGRPVIAFPEGDSSCASWGEGGMVDALAGLIDALTPPTMPAGMRAMPQRTTV